MTSTSKERKIPTVRFASTTKHLRTKSLDIAENKDYDKMGMDKTGLRSRLSSNAVCDS